MQSVHAQTRLQFIFLFEKVVGSGVRTHVDSKGEEKKSAKQPRDKSNSRCCITQDREPCTLPTELFQTLDLVQLSTAPVLYRLAVTLLKA